MQVTIFTNFLIQVRRKLNASASDSESDTPSRRAYYYRGAGAGQKSKKREPWRRQGLASLIRLAGLPLAVGRPTGAGAAG